MKLEVNDELKSICKDILEENKTGDDWAKVEAEDWFQTDNFCGGFEKATNGFAFSYYENEKEFWFDLKLSDVSEILNGNIKTIECRDV